jgi:hypothetical protein
MRYQTIKGEKIPALGLGTWQLSGRECVNSKMSTSERSRILASEVDITFPYPLPLTLLQPFPFVVRAPRTPYGTHYRRQR